MRAAFVYQLFLRQGKFQRLCYWQVALFGDERYGGTEILRGERSSTYKAFINNCFKICNRQALHARTLGFVHPTTGQQMDFTSDLPADLAQLIDKWRGYMKGNEYKNLEYKV